MFGLNPLGIIASAIASFIVGLTWYTVLFREPYLKGLGKTAAELAQGPSMLVASLFQFAGCLVIAAVLNWLIIRTQMNTVPQALSLAILVWAGFIVAVIGPIYAYQAFSFRFFLIVVGNLLVAFLMTGAILSAWK